MVVIQWSQAAACWMGNRIECAVVYGVHHSVVRYKLIVVDRGGEGGNSNSRLFLFIVTVIDN